MRQGYLFIAVPGLWQPATIHYMDPLSVGVFAIVGATTFIVLDDLALPIFDLSHDTT